jgi:hypothetical protein
MQTIDSLSSLLDSAAVRHYQRWPILGVYVWPNNFIGQTYDAEVNYLKTWITNRLTWMDANMFGSCDALANTLPTLESVRVFPNPSDALFYIDGISSPSTGYLYNQTGQLIKSIALDSFTTSVSTASLPNGLYYIQIDHYPTIFKLIIQH